MKGIYNCLYCKKELVSLNCDCEDCKKNLDIWDKHKRHIKKQEKENGE